MNGKRIFFCLLVIAGSLGAATLTRELDVAPGGTLEVNLRGGSIEVVGADRGTARVEVTSPGGEEPAVDIRREGDRIVITSPRRNRLDVRVALPRRFDLRLDTMGGNISVSNLTGTLRGSTLGGNLTLERLGGRLDMRTHGGNILLRESDVDGSVTTMGGRVLVENVTGDVTGTSMGGNVEYRNVTRRDGSSTGKAVTITTMGGEVRVDSAPHGAEVSTMGGNVVVGNAGRFVKARTMGGHIAIESVDGWVEATTMGGDVEVRMSGDPGSGDRHVTIESRGGDVELTLPAGMDAAFDVEIAFTRTSSRDFRISSAFPLAVSTSPDWEYGEGQPRRLIRGRGTAGSGKNKVTIRTVNGDVTIRRD